MYVAYVEVYKIQFYLNFIEKWNFGARSVFFLCYNFFIWNTLNIIMKIEFLKLQLFLYQMLFVSEPYVEKIPAVGWSIVRY